MTKGLPRSIGGLVLPTSPIVKQTVVIRNKTLTVDGASGVGFGSFVAEGLPEGNLLFLGAVANLQFSGPTSANLVDDWEGDFGVGTTPADDATITAADVDLIASTALAAATAEASPVTRGTGVGPVVLDNTGATLELNVNLLVDDADINADGIDVVVNGEIYLSYVVLGDD